jgi:hypothetical protein
LLPLKHVGQTHIDKWSNQKKSKQRIDPKIRPQQNEQHCDSADDDKLFSHGMIDDTTQI